MNVDFQKIKGRCVSAFHRVNYQVRAFERSALERLDHNLYNMTGRTLSFRWEYPAKQFEERYDVQGISQDYVMPSGKAMFKVAQHVLYAKDSELPLSKLNELLDDIVSLNPCLKSLTYDRSDERNVLDVIFGVTSAFNPNDIQYFLDTNSKIGDDKVLSSIMLERFLNTRAHAKMMDIDLGWIPSPQTLAMIKKQCGYAADAMPSQAILESVVNEDGREYYDKCFSGFDDVFAKLCQAGCVDDPAPNLANS